jgi:alkylated DNA repair dioxygenase AlkB
MRITQVVLSQPDGVRCLHVTHSVPEELLTAAWAYLQSRRPEMTHDQFVIGGRPGRSQYKSLAFGDRPGQRYHYAGMSRPCEELAPPLRALRDWIWSDVADGGYPLNYVLVNYYPSLQQGIGLHADKIQKHRRGSEIIALSLGATRYFAIKPTAAPASPGLQLPLCHGDLVTMSLPMQQQFKHQLLTQRGQAFVDPLSGLPTLERYCLTFRSIIDDDAAPSPAGTA